MPFTPQQEQALALISAGSTVSDAAQSADPKAPAGVRLKAAQIILNLATNPTFASPAAFPKTIESVHNSAQWTPAVEPEVEPIQTLSNAETVHNSAQSVVRATPKPGRNDLCPCGSGKKLKRCCLNQPVAAPQPLVA